MLRSYRRVILGSLLALCATGAVVSVTATVAEASVGATIRTVTGAVKTRTGPTTKSTQVGTVANRARITIACRVTGEYVKGAVSRTTQWDRLTNGRYVSHAYVRSGAIPVCPPPPPPPVAVLSGPVGAMTNTQFIAASAGPAQQGWREYGVPASVTMAQAILESGWGRSSLTANDRNYFGIKCFSTTPGPIHVGCHVYRTSECQPICLPTTASFRVYASITDSFRDHGRFLTVNSRYRPAFGYTRNANQFAIEIHKAGYATSPAYATNLINLMVRYNLYQFDIWR
jgi:flagellar protein FlgJ